MIYQLDEPMRFGKYNGYTIRQIYQGTLCIDRGLLSNYLNHILNADKRGREFYGPSMYFAEEFEVTGSTIRTIGEIFDPEKPLSDSNRVHLGNIERDLSAFIECHFKGSFLGVLDDIDAYMRKYEDQGVPLGEGPSYLRWCESNVDGFQLSKSCKELLEKMPRTYLRGINIMYIGNETYEYMPDIEIMDAKED
ncbi:hypothetical protein [Nafulsella turpanensis]|uniref:hypothetical protein n=1 Tax=Nafulsella turpanensis TaxID=1265690 RepID=UPI00037370B6|nr:hypothetical protein [Nafulsella turpanensis]